jgi:hypothetical protein
MSGQSPELTAKSADNCVCPAGCLMREGFQRSTARELKHIPTTDIEPIHRAIKVDQAAVSTMPVQNAPAQKWLL